MTGAILIYGISAIARTLRIRWKGEPLPATAIVAFWHSKMIAGWWVSKDRAVAMVSKSKDGGYLSAILSKWGYKLVRGSSGKSGMEALQEAMNYLISKSASRIVITPDGPRGPFEEFKRGAFIASNELQAPLYFLEIHYSSSITLKKSWDKFQIPLPFSSVTITAHRINTSAFPAMREEQTDWLKRLSQQYRSKQ